MTDQSEQVPKDELNKPIPKRSLPPLPDLPDREWLAATVADVEYIRAMFNGQIQYLTDKEKNPILGEDDQPIERRQFKITYEMKDYTLPNGGPRKGWLQLGCSWGKNAKLPKYLKKVGFKYDENDMPTPAELIKFLKGQHVFIQFEFVEDDEGGQKQKLGEAKRLAAGRVALGGVGLQPPGTGGVRGVPRSTRAAAATAWVKELRVGMVLSGN